MQMPYKNKSQLRCILLGAISFMILLFSIDWAVGSWNEQMYHKAKYGFHHRVIYSIEKSDEDILILGSSRACHHYVSQMIQDSVGMSCYNAGYDGMSIYYHYALLASRLQRGKSPKLVILDVIPKDVRIVNTGAATLEYALNALAPYFGMNNEIDSLFEINGWKELLKMKSKSFRFNSKLVQTIKCDYIPTQDFNGYEPLFDVLNESDATDNEDVDLEQGKIDSTKIRYITKFIELCKTNNIKLMIYYSPYYRYKGSSEIEVVKHLSNECGIPFYDYADDQRFQHREFFKDIDHLNDNGARVFTNVVIANISSLIIDN
jgi:hypothetical protein